MAPGVSGGPPFGPLEPERPPPIPSNRRPRLDRAEARRLNTQRSTGGHRPCRVPQVPAGARSWPARPPRRGRRPAGRLPPAVPGGTAGAPHRPVGALRPRLRRVVRPEVRPRVGRAERRHRRDRPPLAERAPCARRHRGRDAAGTRPLRVPRVAGGYEAHVAPVDRRRDRVRAPVRAPPRLSPQGHVQPAEQAVLRAPRELGPRRRSTTGRDLWGRPGSSRTPGSWSARARGRSARSAGSRPGSGSRRSPTAT